jgi:hypothetical protein
MVRMPSVEDAWRAISEAKDNVIEYARPDLILLTGSMGRGDWMCDPGGTLLSDVEMVFITAQRWSRRAVVASNTELGIKYGVKVGAFGVSRRSFGAGHLRNLCYGRRGHVTLQYRDALYASKTLYQRGPVEPDELGSVLPVNPWEGFRLLVNRLADLLVTRPDPADPMSMLDLLKILQACGDGSLVVRSEYSPDSAARARRLEELWHSEIGGDRRSDDESLLAPILAAYQQRRDNVLDSEGLEPMLERGDLAPIVAFWLKDILQRSLSSREESLHTLLDLYLSSELTSNYDYYFFGIGGARYQNGVVLLRNLYKGTPTPVGWHTLQRPYLHISYVCIALCFFVTYGPDVMDTSALDRLLGALRYSPSEHGQGGPAAYVHDVWRGIS